MIRKTEVTITGIILITLFALTGTAYALSATCMGAPSTSSITWTGAASDGVSPFAFLWGNGATSTVQTVSALPGTHIMSLQVTDASSTVATTTCSATVAQPVPSISSFTASPASIIVGQSSTLSWVVVNASSTSISGVGTVTGTSVAVSPIATTVYTLSAVNPLGTTTANRTVVVSATSTSSVVSQIQALLAQIEALKKQIALLLIGQIPGGSGGTGGSATTTPTGCFNFWRDLRHGDEGEDVRELQRELVKADPTIFPPGLVTGFFGPKTFAALKMFQRRFDIDIQGTGFFGQKSRGHFASKCGMGDADRDGTINSADSDDDNDGTLDVDDRFPFNPLATSTKVKVDDDDRGWTNKGKGKGNSSGDRDGDDGDKDDNDNDDGDGNDDED